MKLEDAKITILIGSDSTTIELIDAKSMTTFAEVTLTPEQLSSALSRMSRTPCSIELRGIERVGKTHEHEVFEFEIDDKAWKDRRNDQTEIERACDLALIKQGKSDWVSDHYYQSQGSFFAKDGKDYARVIIRRWI